LKSVVWKGPVEKVASCPVASCPLASCPVASCPKGAHLFHVLNAKEVEIPYARLVAKYAEILDTHIPTSDPLVLLQSNEEIDALLQEKGYTYTVLDPSDPSSFATAIQCTGSFIGNFNMDTLSGSFTSYYLHVVSACKQSILVDLEHLSKRS
jgi:hypothetical protein